MTREFTLVCSLFPSPEIPSRLNIPCFVAPPQVEFTLADSSDSDEDFDEEDFDEE